MIHKGATKEAVRARVKSMFSAPNRNLIDSLHWTAIAEVRAARGLSLTTGGGGAVAQGAFKQPALFGLTPGGQRTEIGVDFLDPEGNSIIRMTVRDDGSRSLQQQIAEAAAAAKKIINAYPGKFKGHLPNDIDTDLVELVYAATRF
jgi:hypothetical protein